MTLFFAKTKKAGIICAALAVLMLAVTVLTAYYAIGNYLCAIESPVLVAENGDALFLGYYLLAAGYAAVCILSVLFCVCFALNAVRVLRK